MSNEPHAQNSVNIDQLWQELQKSAKLLNMDAHVETPGWVLPEIKIPLLPPKSAYFCEELLVFDGEDFIAACYKAILRREPDEGGMQTYLEMLSAEKQKIKVILSMMLSDEAKLHQTHIQGLQSAKVLWTLTRILRKIKLGRVGNFLFSRYCMMRDQKIRPVAASVHNISYALHGLTNLTSELLAARKVAYDLLKLHHGHSSNNKVGGFVSRQEFASLQEDVQLARADALYQQRATDRLLAKMQASPPNSSTASTASVNSHLASNQSLEAYYVSFEDFYRGNAQAIHDKLIDYLPFVEQASRSNGLLPIVDIGCGRGEWLQILSRHGLNSIGIDLNAVMVDHCQAMGLNAYHVDALAWLSAQPDASLSAITGFHIIEHLPFELLFKIFSEARRVLAANGVIIFETPNPENILVGSQNFYHDFSHRNPVTPVASSFLARYHGFTNIQIRRCNPCPAEATFPGDGELVTRLNNMLYGPQDFALIAYVPAI